MTSPSSLPRVTEILKAAGLVQDYSFLPDDRYARRGTALHLAIQFHAAGTLDLASLHPEIRPAFEAYLAFCEEHQHVAHHSELELTSRHGFMGHLDRVGKLDGHPAVIDWKMSQSPDLDGARLQLAAYGLLYDEAQLGPPARRYVVALPASGQRAKVHDLTDPYAETIFRAALVLFNYRKEIGR